MCRVFISLFNDYTLSICGRRIVMWMLSVGFARTCTWLKRGRIIKNLYTKKKDYMNSEQYVRASEKNNSVLPVSKRVYNFNACGDIKRATSVK